MMLPKFDLFEVCAAIMGICVVVILAAITIGVSVCIIRGMF